MGAKGTDRVLATERCEGTMKEEGKGLRRRRAVKEEEGEER